MKWIEQFRWRMKPFTRKLMNINFPDIPNIILCGMIAVFIMDNLSPITISDKLALFMSQVFRGEVWRLLTFIFLPPSTSILWVAFALYFYWMVGTQLRNHWGSSRFAMFYIIGMIGNIIAALISGYADNSALNLSMFLAFAVLYPDVEFMIFFVIPVKAKYIALLDVLFLGYEFIIGTFSMRLCIVFSLLNIILFLGGDIINYIQRDSKYWKTRRNFRKAMRNRNR